MTEKTGPEKTGTEKTGTLQSDAEIQQMLRDEIAELNARLQDRFREIATLTQMAEEAEARHRAEMAHQADVLTRKYEVPDAMAAAGAAVAQDGFAPNVAPLEAQRAALQDSALFDSAWYLETYADVGAAGIPPEDHYAQAGAFEGRDPGPDFSSRAYYMANPDVIRAGWPALVHFVMLGQGEGRALSLADPAVKR